MAKTEVFNVLISEHIFNKLPDEEKAKFVKWKEYYPEFIDKYSTYPDGDDYQHFEDEVFDCLEMMELFFGEDWDRTGVIYRKDYLGLGEEEQQYFSDLAEGLDMDGDHFSMNTGTDNEFEPLERVY